MRLAVGGLVGRHASARPTARSYDVARAAAAPAGRAPSLDGRSTASSAGRLDARTGGARCRSRRSPTLALEPSPTGIQHYDRERSVTVTAQVAHGFNTDRRDRARCWRGSSRTPLPAGYRIVAAGEIESRQESFGGLGTAIIVAVFGVLAILVLEFRTFRSTLIVASVIPLGVIGGLVALCLTGYTLSFTAMIGFVALIGIEIKNSILLVDFTNQLRERGRCRCDEAIERAGEIRFVPILLTIAHRDRRPDAAGAARARRSTRRWRW